MNILVSVVVVAKNEERNIGACIESVLAQDYPQNRYEVIVVDGGSTDKTQAIAQRYPVRLVVADRAAIGYQRNIGVRNAQGEYVAFTDADCVADKQWLRKLVTALERREADVVAVGGPNLVFETDPDFARVVGHMQETLAGSGGSAQSYAIGAAKRVKSIPNCNAIYLREALISEQYDDWISCGDDLDINYRLAKKGFAFQFLPDAVVWHHRPANIRGFVRKMFSYGEGVARVTRKNGGIVRWYAFAAGLMVIGILIAYPLIRFVPYLAYVYAVAGAVYLGVVLFSAVQAAASSRSLRSLETVVLLPLQHLAYGLGFLKGMFVPKAR